MQPAAAPGATQPAFAVGDRFPNFVLPDAGGVARDFYAEVTGRPLLLLLADSLVSGPGGELWQALAGQAEALAALDLELFVVSREIAAGAPVARMLALRDDEGRLLGHFLGGQGGGRLIALDSNQRALALPSGGAGQQADLCREALAAWRGAQGTPQVRRGGAPVLLLPDVLPPELCAALIALWQGSNREGQVSAGSSENFYVADRKRNREHDVTDPEMTRQIARCIARRVGPELIKVFNFTQRYTLEPFIVLGYDPERRDFFGRHRDRYRPEHPRRFAMSLNLNEGFEGGALRFPEYSQDLYSPPAGGACVFSCSLLHEALPVSRGRRFAMTTFFHAAEGLAPGAR